MSKFPINSETKLIANARRLKCKIPLKCKRSLINFQKRRSIHKKSSSIETATDCIPKILVRCFQLQNRRIFFISFVLPSFHFSGFQFVLLQKFLTAIDHSTVVFPPFEKAAAIPVEPDQKWTSIESFILETLAASRQSGASGRTRRPRRVARRPPVVGPGSARALRSRRRPLFA